MVKKLILIVLAIIIVWIVAVIVRIRVFARRAGKIISNTQVFQQEGKGEKKVLILGDSIAYGTGTTSPENSVAGLIALNHFPNAKVINMAENGMRTNELANSIMQLEGTYDLIFIIIGGNDILRPWLNIKDSGSNLKKIYKEASMHSTNVIALTTGNFRYTTFFPYPINLYFGQRSIALRNLALKASKEFGVQYIDIISYNERVRFTPEMEASDHLHLSDQGAEYWYSEIKRVSGLK